eukprot:Selendium_serpulae@DN7008_c0_g1_i1.p1
MARPSVSTEEAIERLRNPARRPNLRNPFLSPSSNDSVGTKLRHAWYWVVHTTIPFIPIRVALGENMAKRLRWLRVLIVAAFTALYLFIITSQNTRPKLAPVADAIRKKLFNQRTQNDLANADTPPTLEKMMSTADVIDLLNSVQMECKSNAMVDEMGHLYYDCDLQSIWFGSLNPNEGLCPFPCDNAKVLKRMIVRGDLADFDRLPTLLRRHYDEHDVDEDLQMQPRYKINQGHPLMVPLFTGESDQEDARLGPLPLMNEKLNLIGQHLGLDEVKADVKKVIFFFFF